MKVGVPVDFHIERTKPKKKQTVTLIFDTDF